MISWAAPGRYAGTAYEILDECRYDLDATVKWLTDRGHQRVALVGVSMGAVKVIYYQAYAQDPKVGAVVAISPVRLSRAYYLASDAAEEYEGFYKQAKELVESGHPDAVIATTFPNPPLSLFGAAAYLDKYGQERYNPELSVDKIRCPLLLLAGALETHPRLRDCARDVYDKVKTNPNAKLIIIEGGSHGLPELGDRLADTVVQWLQQPMTAAPA